MRSYAGNRAYTPERLLEYAKEHTGAGSIVALAHELHMGDTTLRQIRDQRVPITAKHLLRIHETTGINVAYLRDLIGDTSELPYEPPEGRPYAYRWE